MKKHMIYVLLIAMLSGMMTSCGGGEAETETAAETVANVETIPETVAETRLMDNVPELDFGGETLTFSTSSFAPTEMDVDEAIGEITNDAVFNRNMMMEERFNVVIDQIVTDNPTHAEHPAYIRSSIMAQDHAFDIVASIMYTAGTMTLDNLFMDWGTVPYVDLGNPWWVKNINDCFTVHGKLFNAVSDTCLTSMQLAYVYLFNVNLAEDYQVEDLYSVVEKGRWTLDYVYDLTKDIYVDTNGDGVRGLEDIYGFVSDTVTSLDCYMLTSGQPIFIKTDTGIEVGLGTERALSVYEKVYKLLFESEGSLVRGVGTEYTDKYTVFMDDRALVIPVRLVELYSTFRDMEGGYGILPYPKYDELQNEYYTSCLDAYSVLCIPNNVENIELVGALSEAMACESKYSVMPVFYETALQEKYSRDAKSAEMLDIIMDGRTFDLCVLYSEAAGGAKKFLRNVIREDKPYVSAYESSKKMLEGNAANLYEKLKNIGN